MAKRGSSGEGPLDPEVEKGIREATSSLGQPEAVAQRLINWLGEASLGRTDLGNVQQAEMYFDALRDAMSSGDSQSGED